MSQQKALYIRNVSIISNYGEVKLNENYGKYLLLFANFQPCEPVYGVFMRYWAIVIKNLPRMM
jgi:hypothetical protein